MNELKLLIDGGVVTLHSNGVDVLIQREGHDDVFLQSGRRISTLSALQSFLRRKGWL